MSGDRMKRYVVTLEVPVETTANLLMDDLPSVWKQTIGAVYADAAQPEPKHDEWIQRVRRVG